MPLPRPVWYWLENGERTRAILYRVDSVWYFLIVDVTTPEASGYIGKEDWFEAEYVKRWNGLVPECCDEGTEPGQWSEVEQSSGT